MSADTDRLITPLREILAEDGWVPGSVAMNKLDAVAAALEAAEAELAEYSTDVGYAAGYQDAKARAEAAEAQRDTLIDGLAQAKNNAQWLLTHWTEPAFVRSTVQETSLQLARDVLAALAVVAPPEAET